MLTTLTTILTTLTLLASANPAPAPQATDSVPNLTSAITPEQFTKISADVAHYLTSVTAQPEYTGAVAALATVIPESVQAEIAQDPQGYLQSALQNPLGVPDWYSSLPASYQNYFSSIGAEEIKIATSDVAAAGGAKNSGSPSVNGGSNKAGGQSTPSPTAQSTNAAPAVKAAGAVIGAGVVALLLL